MSTTAMYHNMALSLFKLFHLIKAFSKLQLISELTVPVQQNLLLGYLSIFFLEHWDLSTCA